MTTNPNEGSDQPLHFEMSIADTLTPGVYSNFLGVWHTAHEFTLDFAVTQPATLEQTTEGQVTRVPCQVVARIKVPPTVMFDFLRTVNENLTQWERNFGGVSDQ